MDIAELSYYYITILSKAKGYNLQSIANKAFVAKADKRNFIMDLHKDPLEFNEKYQPYISRDIVFKNNSLVTRKSLLISPAHYFYYTNLVFEIVLEDYNKTILQYNKEKITAFYSGILFKSLGHISSPREILFDNSYNQFQEKLIEFEGRQAIELDLSSFFESIHINDLLDKLYTKYKREKVKSLETFFEEIGLTKLPQFHYSIASSILSQEYLSEFDNEIQMLLKSEDLEMVRFVDDMYFFNNGSTKPERKFHEFLDTINNMLWLDGLNLNTNKVALYIDRKKLFDRELSEVSYGGFEFKVVKDIEEKASSLIEQDFFKFIIEANKLYMKKGYDIKGFSELFDKTFSVKSGEARKVLNNFVYSNKWTKLSNKEMKYIILHYHFVFFLPDIFLILYLKIYDYIEMKHGRDEDTIRKFLGRIDDNNINSLRYLYSSLNYLIQRNFKREKFLERLTTFNKELGGFINNYIK